MIESIKNNTDLITDAFSSMESTCEENSIDCESVAEKIETFEVQQQILKKIESINIEEIETKEITAYEILQHPLLLLIVGASITSIVVPWRARLWTDHKKKVEIKSDLINMIVENKVDLSTICYQMVILDNKKR